MAERRNRRSSLDTGEETKHPSRMSERNSWIAKEHQPRHRTGRYDEFSASGTTGTPKAADNSGWQSWDLSEEKPIAPKNDSFIKSRLGAPDGNEIGGRNRYHRNVSPGFDGIERHNYNHSLENDRTRPHRYVERGGTRSRSRSRTRGRSRSRSRSLSRGRERERERVRERSRSRGDRSARDRASPKGGYRLQSYERSERTEPGKSSQICRNFPAGRCKRGSQCRFIHPDDTNRRDRNLVEDRSEESWRNRSDHENRSTHSYGRDQGFEPRDDVYHGDTEQFHTKARNEIPCNNFLKGKCGRGDSCKFSHHFASDDSNSFGEGNRNTSFDRDIERQAKNEKPLCKYFVAGNCDRGDNCGFSHMKPKVTYLEGRRGEFTDDHILHDKGNTWNDRGDNYRISQKNPKSTNLEGRQVEFTEDSNLHDKGNNNWNGPTWGNDEARKPDIVPRENPKSTNLQGRRGEITDDHNLCDKGNNTWNGMTWDEEARKPDIVSMGWNEPISMNMTTTVDTISRRSDDKSWGEWTDNSLNREKKPSPLKEMGSYGSTDSFGKYNISNEQEHLTLHPSQFNQAGISSQRQNIIHKDQTLSVTPLSHNVSPALHFQQQQQQPNETYRGMNMPVSNRSEGFSIDLNGPGTEMVDRMELQNHQEAVQQPIISETNTLQNFPYSLTSVQCSEVTNYPVTISNPQVVPLTDPNVGLTNSFVNEESQTYAGIEVMSPWGTISSNPINSQPDLAIVSFDRSNPMESGGDANEHWSHSLTTGLEPNNQMRVKQSSAPLPIVGKEFDNSKKKYPSSPKLKQEDVVVDSVENGGKKTINEESKGPEEKKVPETVEGHGKIEENDSNKDEKGMRLFKNCLIEFVKELLKPKWKEGKMSREVHKTIVKKVVEKVTTTIQADHVPKTQDKVEMYLSSSKPKLLKLVQAYVERCQKKDS